MTDNPPSGHCLNCDTETTNQCPACENAPSYHGPGGLPRKSMGYTWLCSPSCQAEFRHLLKVECRQLQRRKKVARAAELLQGIMFVIGRHATTLRFDWLNVKERSDGVGDVYLHRSNADNTDTARILTEFPATPEGLDERVSEGLWTHKASETAMMVLYFWVIDLLSESCSKIEEIGLIPPAPKLRIYTKPDSVTCWTLARQTSHTIYRIRMRGSGEQWALDPTCSQFGYRRPLIPWDEVAVRTGKGGMVGFKTIHAHGASHLWWHHLGCNPTREQALQRMEVRGVWKAVHAHRPMFTGVFGRKGKLSAILDGSEVVFEEVKGKFLDVLEDIVKEAVVSLYTPEKVRRRNDEIDRMFNPESEESTENNESG